MLSREQVWAEVAALAQSEGLNVYDIDHPSGGRGVLRVFLCNSEWGAKGVGLQECTRVARKINDAPNVEELMPGECTLEVSSPGVNRKLVRLQHYLGAVGEGIKVSLIKAESDKQGARRPIKGVLVGVDETRGVISVQQDGVETPEVIALSEIRDARVDFKFEEDLAV